MSQSTKSLMQLERIAQMKSDLEMRHFSAFRQHIEAAQARIDNIKSTHQALYASETDFSVAEARLINALAQDHSRALIAAEHDLAQMRPRYDAARAQAQREFGRAEVIKTLRKNSAADDRDHRVKKQDPTG
ncbi:hypothetical protein [Paracoccus aestuariivivens]|uniref:Flagellar export protein FliJ n=1 Tax=Paracoccus aestuariivivens TaxID=1820333 RepID=A0A6L6JJK9_9RHOB|nr:hypothetical protein [Paracoccus aestuariivivens]MTH80031.1 hypothetical protein [Paracoccus aestuariivivens]